MEILTAEFVQMLQQEMIQNLLRRMKICQFFLILLSTSFFFLHIFEAIILEFCQDKLMMRLTIN